MKVLIVVVVLLVPLAGGLNYVRNEPLDKELEERPYAGMSDADLTALISAYEGEIQYGRAGIDGAPESTAHTDPGQHGHFEEKVQAFEKFQNTNTSWKKQRRKVFEQEATVDALRHEMSIRERKLDTEWGRIWRRVKTI